MDIKKIRSEAALTQYMFTKASAARIPLSGTFELSPICNFNCRMCYVRKTAKEVAESERPLMTCDQWIELAQELRKEGMLYLLLTGGEPFLWPDFWRLYEELSKMGFLISINSNGSLINDEIIERLKEFPPTRINITLYGASDDTYLSLCGVKGVFAKVDQVIMHLKEAGIPVKLNCSLTPQNAADLEEMIKYAEERELILEVATYMFPPMRRDSSMVGQNERFTPYEAAYYNLKHYRLQYGEDLYYEYLENVIKGLVPSPGLEEFCVDPVDGKVRCRAGKSVFWITWDGWLTPCGMLDDPKVDITTHSFREGWKKIVKESEDLTLSGVCKSCSNRKICHSCAAVAKAETGTFSGIPRYLCEEMAAAKSLAESDLAGYSKN